jgi:DNA-binding NarL/FixJ family response regulator
MKIVIADDHEMFRSGLKKLLDLEQDMDVVGEADSGSNAVRLCRAMNPDVALIDYDMPDMDGLEATREILKLGGNTRIIILTMYDNEDIAIKFIQAGASGFVPKKTSFQELVFALRKVLSGSKYVTTSISDATIIKPNSDKSITQLLSEREFEVFLLLARGLSMKEISEDTSLAYNTVKTYKNRIMDKMEFKNLTELARYAISQGLTDKHK